MLSNGVTNIDSVTKYTDYVERAKELNMKALAFSEHGSIFEWVHKKNAIEQAGMKYIHAEEFYITRTLDEKIRDNYHCLLIAKNYDGVLELNKLSSKSFNRENNSYYYVPRISYNDLKNTSSNIIICTACLAGILSKGDRDLKNNFFKFILDNKDRCFLELQPHLDEQQIKYNKQLYDLSIRYDINCVMCTDTHALNKEHIKGRSILQRAKNIHFDNEDNFHLEMMSYDELIDLCKQQNAIPIDGYLKAIEQTNKIADMVEPFELNYDYKYPHLWGDDSEKIFKQKIMQGIKTRGVDKYPNYQEYIDRIKYELKAYKHNKAIDFMLLMEDIVRWCKTQDIQIGYGRGSVNGSVVAWLLNITEMDSIKFKLNFDRYMNVERVSLSDVDTDFPPNRINEVKKYIFSRHGLYCCDIVTFNTIALKGAIRDVGRALDMPLNIVSDICDNIELKEDELRKEYKELFEYVDLVNGCVVSVGNHPCGLIVSPHSIDDRLGTFTTSTDTVWISQINMKEVDSLNYVKLDLLKLDTIQLIADTCKLANIPMLLPGNMDTKDVRVWNSMRDDTTQIFQWEGDTGNDYIKKLLSDENIKKFQTIDKDMDRMTLLSIGNSAIRPAGASYREDLANGVVRKSGSKAIDDFLKPTMGFLVFQCQIIEFLHSYCGFTMGEADVVRRHFSKKQFNKEGVALTELDIPIIKNGGYMKDKDGNEKTDHYIDGFIVTMNKKYGTPREEAEKTIVSFLQVIIDASRYLFSLNHSQPYSYEGYACGWLRYYYPLQFLTVALNINRDKEEKTKSLINYASKINIKIKNPLFGYSKANYFCDNKNNTIYKGVGSIKFMNGDLADSLYEISKNKPSEFIELLRILKDTNINSRQLDILIKIGYFNEYDNGDIDCLLRKVDIFNNFSSCKSLKKDKCEKLNISCDIVRLCCDKETEKMFSGINNNKLINKLCENISCNYNSENSLNKMSYQLLFLGYTNLTDPTQPSNIYIVQSLETNKYGTSFGTLYQCNSGNIGTYKINRKWYKENELQIGDVIRASIKDQYKWTYVNGKYEQDKEQIETILNSYFIMKRIENK